MLPDTPRAASKATKAGVTQPSIETAKPMMPVASNRFWVISQQKGAVAAARRFVRPHESCRSSQAGPHAITGQCLRPRRL
jgi:hypothetical protein